MTMAEHALIRQVEDVSLWAWPGLEMDELDGWVLRAAGGVTSRANSAWVSARQGSATSADAVLTLDARLAAMESFYRERGLSPHVQITPAAQPSDLDDILAERGYSLHSPTLVQMAELGAVMAATTPLQQLPHLDVEVSEEFDGGWFDLYAHAEGLNTDADGSSKAYAMRQAIVRNIRPTRAFASLRIGGERVAVGLGVVQDGWLGIFCMHTLPQARRRGAATAILRTLAIWGQLYDARRAYLQVSRANLTAQALYAGLGFGALYGYHYRRLAD